MNRAIVRFIRVVAAAAVAGALAAAVNHVSELPINDSATIAGVTAILVALDKYLRDRGIY